MFDGLILLAIFVIFVQVWQYTKHRYVHLPRNRKYLLPVVRRKSAAVKSHASIVLKGNCTLESSIGATGFNQVLKVSGAMHLMENDSDFDEFFFATLYVRQAEGVHPFGQYIGAVWPRHARSFSESEGVDGEFFLSAQAFQFLLDACDARLGVERAGKDDKGRAAVVSHGELRLHFDGVIAHARPRHFAYHEYHGKFDRAFMVSDIDKVESDSGYFTHQLEHKIGIVSDDGKREALSRVLSYLKPAEPELNVPTL